MKKLLFFSFFLFFQLLFSQVSLEKNRLVKDGKTYKLSEYEEVFKNPEALGTMKKARTNGTIATVLGVIGGAGIGVSIPMLLTKEEKGVVGQTPSGPVYGQTKGSYGIGYLLLGAGFVGAAIPFAVAAKKNSDRAVQIENGRSTGFQPYFRLENVGNGIALSYHF
ncbi:hypothetical protein [Chryseobacterium koreense]